MSSWSAQKANLLQQKTEIDAAYNDAQVTSKINEMNAALARYTSRAGISASPDSQSDVDYAQSQRAFSYLSNGITRYTDLNKNVSRQLANMSGNADVQAKLQQVGQLRQELPKLEKELKDLRNDLETAHARQGNTEKPEKDLSFYQGFGSIVGFTKPIHKVSVPILIGFGVLLLFLSGLMLREFFSVPTMTGALNSAYNSGGVMALFTDSRFYSVAAGATLVFVVVGILAFSGKLGKTV
jgi:hypothetical protein